MENLHDQDYVNAREALLDAIEALEAHRDAVILVGAQAVYAHTEKDDVGFAISPFTYDADLALDPHLLADSPAITEAMNGAGFKLGAQPGLYRKGTRSQVDLLVPEAVGGPGRRGARLGTHGNSAAMKVHGLEGALVSHIVTEIKSMVPNANRSCLLKVAGPAALLVSKVHKIGERLQDPDARRREQLPKDAFDIYRLLRATQTHDLAAELRILQSHEISSGVTAGALSTFQRLFGSRSSEGTLLLVRSIEALEDDPSFIIESSVALTQDLVEATSQHKED